MTREFVLLPFFDSQWKALGLSDADLRRLQIELLVNPKAGDVVEGTGGVRKLRFAFPGRGKSGSTRVIYIDIVDVERLYLLTVYEKADKENLTKSERNDLRQLVEALKQAARRKKA